MPQMEMRNMLLEHGGKVILIFFKKVAENLMDLCSTILWKVELVSDNHGF